MLLSRREGAAVLRPYKIPTRRGQVYRARTGKKKWRDPSTGAASIATTKRKQGGRGHVVSCPYRAAGTETCATRPTSW